jgi:hypothetical protein
MTLQKITLKPGVNRENTRYALEGGYYESEKVRFRQGTPEKIGGWIRISTSTFLGVCRSLWNWVTLGGQNLLGVGTNLKFYIGRGGSYYDITPIRATTTYLANNPFTTVNASTTVTVTATSHGGITGDFVTFSGATAVAGLDLNNEYQISLINANSYTITAASTAGSSTSGGGASVVAAYQLNVGPDIQVPLTGWGAGYWGLGSWGSGNVGTEQLRIWSQSNYGEDLIFGPRGGGVYYWTAEDVAVRGVNINTLGGTVTFTNATPTVVTLTNILAENTRVQFAATSSLPTGVSASTTYYLQNVVSGVQANIATYDPSTGLFTLINTSSTGSGVYISLLVDAPLFQNFILISDVSRFVILFGCNDIATAAPLDPMLIRWSNQESVVDWYPSIANQAGSVRLSHGSTILTAVQVRQEILVWTDSSLYNLQYLGPPLVWGTTLIGDNLSIISPNAAIIASGTAYWMGVDKFYKYDGRVSTMRCDVRQYVFNDINLSQGYQVFAGTNEGFNEVWWFYCSVNSTTVDKYVIYNYLEDIWYYGNMARSAWLDSGLSSFPMAATYLPNSTGNIVNHESGVDDGVTATLTPITASITSSQFDIGDGHNMAFVWRMLPDLTFRGSTDGTTPSLTMQLLPLQNSGSGYNDPRSVGGTSTTATQSVTATQTYPIDLDTFTGQINIRIRGRQMAMRIESTALGTQWQLGSPRIDIRPDGRR